MARRLECLLTRANLRQVIGGAGRRRERFAVFIQQSANLRIAEILDPRLDLAQRQIGLLQLSDELQAQQVFFAIQRILAARIGPRQQTFGGVVANRARRNTGKFGQLQGNAPDIEIHARELLREQQLTRELLAHDTGQPLDRIAKDFDRDLFMTPQQALEYGIIDQVLTDGEPDRPASAV